ncbi:hypothetical protein KDL01_16355 [Actinospica durhamensis]|uniref:Uncharacterized protein n=1 Tax=Actinospica durhamensis TaxID=1508375 RepID=A0A941EPM3_9ACTN|nr:hypothetical protein [Actinospica durhamensis]MBR7834846.1 hypothetical protein [Actinospica durhamensis]
MTSTPLPDFGTEFDARALAEAGWSIRPAQGRGERQALEVYAREQLIDVLVFSRLSAPVLCGAWQSGRGQHASVLVWGHAAPEGGLPTVELSHRSGLFRRASVHTATPVAADAFWLALFDGPAHRVRVATTTGRAECARVRAGGRR